MDILGIQWINMTFPSGPFRPPNFLNRLNMTQIVNWKKEGRPKIEILAIVLSRKSLSRKSQFQNHLKSSFDVKEIWWSTDIQSKWKYFRYLIVETDDSILFCSGHSNNANNKSSNKYTIEVILVKHQSRYVISKNPYKSIPIEMFCFGSHPSTVCYWNILVL